MTKQGSPERVIALETLIRMTVKLADNDPSMGLQLAHDLVYSMLLNAMEACVWDSLTENFHPFVDRLNWVLEADTEEEATARMKSFGGYREFRIGGH